MRAKETEFADVVKAGRTHLMDAVPVTLGQEFGGYARQVELGAERVLAAAQATAELPLGGTAAGTGLNAAPGLRARRSSSRVSARTGVAFREAADHFEAQSAQDAVVELSGALKVGRRQPDQDLQRPALDVVRPARRGSARSTCPTSSPGRASCPARSTRSCPRPP